MIASTAYAILDAAGELVTGAEDAVVASSLMRRIPRARVFVRVIDGVILGRKQLPSELSCPHPGNGFLDRGHSK